MVCDAAMVVSLMMNGICCIWQQQNEEQRRDIFRNDIRVEYLRHRLLEQELIEQQRLYMIRGNATTYKRRVDVTFSDSDIIERRKKLMLDKFQASMKSSTAESSPNKTENAPAKLLEGKSPYIVNTATTNFTHCEAKYKDIQTGHDENTQHSISLADSDDDEDDEDEEEQFEDVSLQNESYYK